MNLPEASHWGYVWWIYFDVTWNLSEIWVEYGYTDIPTGSSIKTQIIPVNTDKNDKSYASFIVPNCTSSCKIYVRPYIKESGSTTRIYKNNWSWYKVNYWTTVLTSVWGWTKIANVWEEDLSEESWESNENEEIINDSEDNIWETD